MTSPDAAHRAYRMTLLRFFEQEISRCWQILDPLALPAADRTRATGALWALEDAIEHACDVPVGTLGDHIGAVDDAHRRLLAVLATVT